MLLSYAGSGQSMRSTRAVSALEIAVIRPSGIFVLKEIAESQDRLTHFARVSRLCL